MLGFKSKEKEIENEQEVEKEQAQVQVEQVESQAETQEEPTMESQTDIEETVPVQEESEMAEVPDKFDLAHLLGKTESGLKTEFYAYQIKEVMSSVAKSFLPEKFDAEQIEKTYNGEQFINRGVLHHFLLHLVKLDSGYAPFKYIDSEKEVSIPYTIRANGTEIELRLGGKIDRIDTKGDTINIIDYKTGYSSTETKTSLENIFAFETKSAANRLQAFLYSVVIEEMLCGNAPVHKEENWLQELKMHDTRKVSPSLLYIHNMENVKREEYTIDILKNPVTDISTIKKEYMEKLTTVIEEIFDVNTPFSPCDDKKRCEYCDYRKICGK